MSIVALMFDANSSTGNHYAIENEHGKAARIFFSQGCEAVPED